MEERNSKPFHGIQMLLHGLIHLITPLETITSQKSPSSKRGLTLRKAAKRLTVKISGSSGQKHQHLWLFKRTCFVYFILIS